MFNPSKFVNAVAKRAATAAARLAAAATAAARWHRRRQVRPAGGLRLVLGRPLVKEWRRATSPLQLLAVLERAGLGGDPAVLAFSMWCVRNTPVGRGWYGYDFLPPASAERAAVDAACGAPRQAGLFVPAAPHGVPEGPPDDNTPQARAFPAKPPAWLLDLVHDGVALRKTPYADFLGHARHVTQTLTYFSATVFPDDADPAKAAAETAFRHEVVLRALLDNAYARHVDPARRRRPAGFFHT